MLHALVGWRDLSLADCLESCAGNTAGAAAPRSRRVRQRKTASWLAGCRQSVGQPSGTSLLYRYPSICGFLQTIDSDQSNVLAQYLPSPLNQAHVPLPVVGRNRRVFRTLG